MRRLLSDFPYFIRGFYTPEIEAARGTQLALLKKAKIQTVIAFTKLAERWQNNPIYNAHPHGLPYSPETIKAYLFDVLNKGEPADNIQPTMADKLFEGFIGYLQTLDATGSIEKLRSVLGKGLVEACTAGEYLARLRREMREEFKGNSIRASLPDGDISNGTIRLTKSYIGKPTRAPSPAAWRDHRKHFRGLTKA
jgi:hypothetical protein